jgi:uncharacterized protein YbjT (DUF2867 family)
MRIAVTGSYGLLGRAIVQHLELQGHEVSPYARYIHSAAVWNKCKLKETADPGTIAEPKCQR